MSEKVLIIDDEEDIRFLVKYNLEKEGFTVYEANNGLEGINKAIETKPAIILLDVMMPELDGIETCERLRQIPDLNNTLICFLTARGEDYSQIAGLDAGGDYYITKPIKPKVLVSRIAAMMRRQLNQSTNEISSSAEGPNIVLNREKYHITYMEKVINLPRKEFELLALLMSRPGVVFERNDIMTRVWGTEVIVGDRTIDVHIRKLREKLDNKFITTIKGVGYKFEQ